MNVVWFKRDLRISDHEALVQAAKQAVIMPLYIFEPALWDQPDMSYRHYLFLQDCLADLDQSLRELGQKLIIKVGDAVDILTHIHQKYSITALWSHQETWNCWTYERDKLVKKWCLAQNIPWYEPAQNGVIRGLKSRDGWAKRWKDQMVKPLVLRPTLLHPIDEESMLLPKLSDFKPTENPASQQQIGKRSQGIRLLHSFLYERGEHYTKEMSSPISAFKSCSRLSPHLAFGTLSIREVLQACEQRYEEISHLPSSARGKWASALRSFSGRLRWHCHFIQKLEDEPRIEFENMHPIYDGLREDDFNEDYFQAWRIGMTGYPMIDACMRALLQAG